MKLNTTQQQISHYLSQARRAIYKEFVPLFLGASSRTRQQFIDHNNESSRVLYKIHPDQLAVVADGSDIKLERSANNKFQYSSFSLQKLNNLLKTFVLCCTDGYIIEAYGAFKANLNDAFLIQYVLQNDVELRRLLVPDSIIVLDRGL